MTKDPWHYPRTEFAKTVLDVLNSGPATALTMFGPRADAKPYRDVRIDRHVGNISESLTYQAITGI